MSSKPRARCGDSRRVGYKETVRVCIDLINT